MATQRRKLSPKHGEEAVGEPSVVQPANESERDSMPPRYHAAHDPELVTDDEIPW
ncbi:hypothetical protein [Sphingobium sp. TCM1]|jgi:hypothetical protein|uniref:hypothetical protein n=1 Tax=Sphingobium sp. TCM1 TaxID=453246 RepID=UPI000A4D070D|nr:hypothetical protein [Sphingobium sp. TCM1]